MAAFINVNKGRIDRWCEAIGTPATHEERIASIIRVVGEDYPDLKDKMQLYLAAQEEAFFDRNLPSEIYKMVVLLEYRPEWIGARVEEMALSAMREIKAEETKFGAYAKAIGITPDRAAVDHLMSTFLTGVIAPSRFVGLSDFEYNYGAEISSRRYYGEHTLLFNYVQVSCPNEEGQTIGISIPIYGLEPSFSDEFKNPAGGAALAKAWDNWMALAQYVGHDELHHMQTLNKEKMFALHVSITRAMSGNATGLVPFEVYIRAFHADRMQLTGESELPQMMQVFLDDLKTFHIEKSKEDPEQADRMAFFLLCGAFDHAIADRNCVSVNVLDQLENAMNDMRLSYQGEPLDGYYEQAMQWAEITEDYERRELYWKVEEYDGTTPLTGLEAVWLAHLNSGSRTARYAYLDALYPGELSMTSSGYIGATQIANNVRNGAIRMALEDSWVAGSMDVLLARDDLEPGVRTELQKFRNNMVIKEADATLPHARAAHSRQLEQENGY